MAICLKAIEDAATAAGNKMPERAAVATAVRALKDFPGITGRTTMDAQRNSSKPAIILTVKNGRTEFVTAVAP